MNVLSPPLSDALRDKLAFYVTFYSVHFLHLLSSPVSNSKPVSYYWASINGTKDDHVTCVLFLDLSSVFSLNLKNLTCLLFNLAFSYFCCILWFFSTSKYCHTFSFSNVLILFSTMFSPYYY